MRNPLVIGNWKLNGNYKIISELISDLRQKLIGVFGCTIVIAPPEIYLDLTRRKTHGSRIILGAQNVDIHLSGAFTGETSAAMLKDIGAKYVIVGHSERRTYHKESNEVIAKKFAILKAQGLVPVLCVGETKEEKESGKTKEVCAHQIDAILKTQGAEAFEDVVVAYEPIWAIGSKKPAPPEEAQKVHKFIRNHISKDNKKLREKIIIQYGGSVDAFNAIELFSQPDIDGALVGGASLNAASFSIIVKAAAESTKNNCDTKQKTFL